MWTLGAVLAITLLLCVRATKPNPLELAPRGPVHGCAGSDARLVVLKETYCASMGGGCVPTGNVTAAGDWPSQSVYMHDLLHALTVSKAAG